MPKPRTKRRDARGKRKHAEEGDYTRDIDTKRQRTDGGDDQAYDHGYDQQDEAPAAAAPGSGFANHEDGPGEKEFFGMLGDEEQEYFRRADELLELNQFPSAEDRALFLESVYEEAKGKELKVASSQSCSRLMERLIQLATTSQKKRLFEAFAGHFLSLVQHRFASHCCEALFLRSAGVVSQELSGFVLDTTGASGPGEAQEPENSMENLFLATLDELEGSMGFLMTDRFASHTLRVLLLVLSGRPLEDAASKTLVKSKKKEKVSVAGSAAVDEQNQGLRAVPESFAVAVTKIIRDSTSSMDATSLRVLATHPIGNPTLQLFLDLDLSLSKAEQKAADTNAEASTQPTLLFQLLPGAPQSLFEETSEATEFINGMIYDPIGSRLVETIIAHAPGKVFKALNQNIFLPRIQGYVRNDVSCYPAIKVLHRIGKDQLVEAVAKIGPTVPQLVTKHRYNVLRTLFERCAARGLTDEIKQLMKGLREGCGAQPVDLVTTLCSLKSDDAAAEKKDVAQLTKNEYAIQSHGAQLLTTLLAIPGPAKGVQESLAALSPELLLRLATTSFPTATLVSTALKTPSANALFQKSTVNALVPHIAELAVSQNGHNVVVAMAEIPTKGRDFSVPAHIKDGVMQALGGSEAALRECWMGRSVWRAWKGDLWKTRRHDWKAWIKDMVAEESQQVSSVHKNGVRAGKRKEN